MRVLLLLLLLLPAVLSRTAQASGSGLRAGRGACMMGTVTGRRAGLPGMHVNDSKCGLGSKRDRHENIGRGLIGMACFECLMNDARLDGGGTCSTPFRSLIPCPLRRHRMLVPA